MSKMKRTKKDYGGGSGREFYSSDFFRVTRWTHNNRGNRTVLEVVIGNTFDRIEICFDGHHVIDSDDKCFDQLTKREIVRLIKGRSKKSFDDGREDKAEEIRKCLGLHR